MQIKRRTTQAPKHAVASDKRALRRGSTIAGTGSSAVNSSRDAGLYKSELNLQDVQGGYGMGMVMPSSTRHAATNASKVLSTVVVGIFSFLLHHV